MNSVTWNEVNFRANVILVFVLFHFFNFLCENIVLTSGKVSWIIADVHQIWYTEEEEEEKNCTKSYEGKKLKIHFEQLFWQPLNHKNVNDDV